MEFEENTHWLSKLLGRTIFRVGRGHRWVSIFLWGIIATNTAFVNLRGYFNLDFYVYLLSNILGVSFVFTAVWLIGYIDEKMKVYSSESNHAAILTPLAKETYDNTIKIITSLTTNKRGSGSEGL